MARNKYNMVTKNLVLFSFILQDLLPISQWKQVILV